jgi:hypothetical protein
VAREGELRDARAQLDRLRAQSDRGLRSLIAIGEELDSVRSQARGQATRIRMAALRTAARLVAETEARNGTAPELSEAAPAPPAVNGNGAAPRVAEDVFVGSVEVEVGPLSDFSQLVGFEDAAGAIGAAKEISVTRFAQGRATLAMKLGEPVELLRELEERAPFDFVVRDTRADRVVLDVNDE